MNCYSIVLRKQPKYQFHPRLRGLQKKLGHFGLFHAGVREDLGLKG